MAERVARGQSSSKRSKKEETDAEPAENGHEAELARDEKELARYLQERIKPGLNRGSIPLLARAIAKEIARDDYHNGASEDDEQEADEELSAEESEADDEPEEDDDAEEDESDLDLQTALQELQAELGDEWILYFAVQGDDTWLTAEKDDASQRVEAPTAAVLSKAVKVLNEGGGRSRREPTEED